MFERGDQQRQNPAAANPFGPAHTASSAALDDSAVLDNSAAVDSVAVDSAAVDSAAVDSAAVDSAADRVDSADPVDRLEATARELARVQARLMSDLVAVADAAPVAEFAVMEIACALTWTTQAAANQLALADDLVRRLPMVHQALSRGDLDLVKARVMVEGVIGCDLSTARQVCAAILPEAVPLTTGQLRAKLAKLVIEADPNAAATRHTRAVAGRRVVLQAEPDSCASLHGFGLPATDATAAANRLSAIARAAKQAGDPRSMDQIRADSLLDLLLDRLPGQANRLGGETIPGAAGQAARDSAAHRTGTGSDGVSRDAADRPCGAGRDAADGPENADRDAPGPSGWASRDAADGPGRADRGAVNDSGGAGHGSGDELHGAGLGVTDGQGGWRGGVELVASLPTLIGLADHPGLLGGYGPVIADIARQVADQQHAGEWTFTINDPATGQIHTGLTRRRPDTATTRHVRQRDRTCRGPGCRVPARRTDLDHTVAVQDGGLTHPGNLGCLCRFHHRAKHEGGWDLEQPEPGRFVWRSPNGHTYRINPDPP